MELTVAGLPARKVGLASRINNKHAPASFAAAFINNNKSWTDFFCRPNSARLSWICILEFQVAPNCQRALLNQAFQFLPREVLQPLATDEHRQRCSSGVGCETDLL